MPMITTHISHNRPIARGFTLLEVMIALLIFSVGLLGLAGLQASSLQSSKIANWRSLAVIEAHDMAERIRANGKGAIGYIGINGIPPAPKDCVNTATCTTNADVATWDAYQWETALKLNLPSGIGTVTQSPAGAFRITVMWDEAGTGALGQNCSGNPNVDLKCFILDFEP